MPTTNRDEWNRYQRLRKRAQALARDKLKPSPKPKGAIYIEPLPRKCRKCGQMKPARMFPSPRWRLCLVCDV